MSPEEPADPNMYWDGTRWLRYDGQQWTDATTGQPVTAEPAVTPGGVYQWLGFTPSKKTGLVIGIVAAAVVVLIIIIVAVVGGGKKDTTVSPPAPAALYTTFETCTSIRNLQIISVYSTMDITSERMESLRSEVPRAQQPLKEYITALVAPGANYYDATRAVSAIGEICRSAGVALSPKALDASPEPAEPAGLPTTIDEGDWTVGVDIKPGTYRTTEPVSGDCYWGIYRAGSNQSDIIDNAIVTGGRPTVTLKKGQEFTNNGCGTFELVK